MNNNNWQQYKPGNYNSSYNAYNVYSDLYNLPTTSTHSKKSRMVLLIFSILPMIFFIVPPLDRFYSGRIFIGIIKLFLPLSVIAAMILSIFLNIWAEDILWYVSQIYALVAAIGYIAWIITDIILAAQGKQKDSKGKYIDLD